MACAALLGQRVTGAAVLAGVTDMAWPGAWTGHLVPIARSRHTAELSPGATLLAGRGRPRCRGHHDAAHADAGAAARHRAPVLDPLMARMVEAGGFTAGYLGSGAAKPNWGPVEEEMLDVIGTEKLLAVERATVEKGKEHA